MQLSLISLALTKVYGGAAAFSPLSLFASGEQGAWYDPSDLSTMFQDSAGTTPVTADGQPVGLILDKSNGLALGAELVVNGDFTVGTGWTLSSATISGGMLVCSAGISLFLATQPVIFGTPKYFYLTVTISGYVSGSVIVVFGVGDNVSTPDITANGTYTFRVLSGSGNSELRIVSGGSGFVGNVDNISIKELQGNHASQATAAARPLYKTDGTYHWLQFDGVDDSLSTAAINFTSTDKMSVFAGFVTTDNVGFDGIIQLGSVASGGFWSYLNTANLEFKVQGSSGVSAVSSAYTPASRSVLTSLMNLGGATGQNCLSTRKNASLFANASIVAGAANFQNGVMTIGVATGVLLTGNIYSLIVRGALSTTDEITATETWVNQRTGAY